VRDAELFLEHCGITKKQVAVDGFWILCSDDEEVFRGVTEFTLPSDAVTEVDQSLTPFNADDFDFETFLLETINQPGGVLLSPAKPMADVPGRIQPRT
jgi:hypothetical protein